MKKSHKDDGFFLKLLSPDLEYCFILDAQNGHKTSGLILLTSYWKLIKHAKDKHLEQQMGNISEEKQDEILHQKIGDFMECVHTYDPDKHKMSFWEFVVTNLLKGRFKKKKKMRKQIDKRFTLALAAISQLEKSTDEPIAGEESASLIDRISGNLPDQESLLHKKTLSDAFSNRILTALSHLESEVIKGIYYRERSDQEVAKELGKTLTKVRSIERKALRKIRNEIRKQRLFEDLSA